MREAVVVCCTTSPVASDTYTCSPLGHENFHTGRRPDRLVLTVH